MNGNENGHQPPVVVKFSLSHDNYEALCDRARADNLSVQDYIRGQLFPGQITITPQDAINLALAYPSGKTFTVPELFGTAWNLPNGMAGQFGKKFYRLMAEQYSAEIRFTGTYSARHHAIYERL